MPAPPRKPRQGRTPAKPLVVPFADPGKDAGPASAAPFDEAAAETLVLPVKAEVEPVTTEPAPAPDIATGTGEEEKRFEAMSPPAAAEPMAAAVAVMVPNMTETMMNEAETISQTAESATSKATAMFGEFGDRSKSAMEKGTKMAEDFADLTKGNIEAVMASSRAAAKGAETLAQTAADCGRKHFEEATRAMKSFTAAKSPTEFLQLSNDYAKSQFDSLVSESSRFSETIMKVWGDVLEPLSSRASVATAKMKSAII